MNTTAGSSNVVISAFPSYRLTLALAVLLILGEFIAPALSQRYEAVYRLYHLVQTVLLIALGFAIKREMQQSGSLHLPLSRNDWTRVITLLTTGIIFSFIGDLINSELVDLTSLLEPQPLLSIPPFALAHICYIAAFYWLSRPLLQTGSTLYLSVTIAAAPILAIGIWSFVIPSDAPGVVAYASLVYAMIIASMVLASLWVLRAWGRVGLPVVAGAFLFLISDSLLGYYLLRPQPFLMGQIIWAAYLLGQLLILRAGLLHRAPLA